MAQQKIWSSFGVVETTLVLFRMIAKTESVHLKKLHQHLPIEFNKNENDMSYLSPQLNIQDQYVRFVSYKVLVYLMWNDECLFYFLYIG